MINYWVTWCIPCKEEVDYIQRIFQDYQAQNIVILSINGIAQDSLNEVQQFMAQHTLTYPVLLDEHDTFGDSFMVKFFPTSFFIDEQGVIRFIQLGGKPEQDFRTMVDQLLTDQL